MPCIADCDDSGLAWRMLANQLDDTVRAATPEDDYVWRVKNPGHHAGLEAVSRTLHGKAALQGVGQDDFSYHQHLWPA